MGFFDGFKQGWENAEKEREQENKKREEWEKAHPGEKYEKEQPRPVMRAFKPTEKKLYQPGHKNMSGTVKNMALINMFGTSDLDEVFEGCAPEFTKAIYGIRDKVYETKDYEKKYFELAGRYVELQKRTDELQKQYDDLSKILQNVTSQQAGR